jgi:YesN/AraC family two-component response regulator
MNKTMRLLIVDDEAEIRDALSRHFRFLGYDVGTAGNGQEALDKLAESKFDIVISDIVMPIMNGTALLRAIRREFPMIHVIIITGYVTQENVMTCMRHGADTCIFKPWPDLRELEEAVSRAALSIEDWKKKMKYLLSMKPKTK